MEQSDNIASISEKMPRLGSAFTAAVGLDMAVALHAERFHFGGSLRADNTLCHQSNPPYSIFNSFHVDTRGQSRGLTLGYQDENKIPPANNRGSVLWPCSELTSTPPIITTEPLGTFASGSLPFPDTA